MELVVALSLSLQLSSYRIRMETDVMIRQTGPKVQRGLCSITTAIRKGETDKSYTCTSWLHIRDFSLNVSHEVQQSASDRSNLLSTASTSSISSPSSSRQRYAQRPTSTLPPAESPFTLPSRPQAHGKRDSGAFTSRTNAALDESTFINSTHNMLDQYIAQGQAVLGNLHTQRDVLKGTQRRLLSVANTLGLSRSTITFIERRSKGDMAVLLAGAVGTFVCFYYILRYFG